jgi:hypothetical protein
MNEIWEDVPGYKGHYMVSNLGNVFTIKNNRLMSPSLTGVRNKYKEVRFCVNGIVTRYKVHQLVAMAFLGHKIDGFNIVVDHIDGDTFNNAPDNLRLTTNRFNVSRAVGGKSKYVGVSWDSRRCKWKSSIRIGNKRIFLGRFNCELSAYKAYTDALNKL